MRHLCLTEYQTLYGIELSSDEAIAVRKHLDKWLSISPGSLPGTFDLMAGSWVGIASAGELTVEIRPKILIPRLLFLLAYRLDPARWHSIPFDYQEERSLIEAVVPSFVALTRRTLRRGPLQGYRVTEESLNTVRGRIRFNEQIGKHFGLVPPIEVEYHEFTEDILENRLLKAALDRLKRFPLRSSETRRLLYAFDGMLEQVESVSFSRQSIPDVIYTRLNEHYRHALELARLILQATSFEFAGGGVRAVNFLVDMNKVFENFVVTALREALGLSASTFPQGGKDHGLYLDLARQIRLEPDISWWEWGLPVFTGDVKYKRLTGDAVKNADIYQLLAYTIAANLPGGLLIYAKGEAAPTVHEIIHTGKRLEVLALDLEQEPDGLLLQVDAIASRIGDLRKEAEDARAYHPGDIG